MIICFSCLHKDKMDAEDNGKICEYSFYANNLEIIYWSTYHKINKNDDFIYCMIYWAYDKECKYCNQKKFVLINYGMSINKYKDVVYKQKVINDIS